MTEILTARQRCARQADCGKFEDVKKEERNSGKLLQSR